MKEQAIMERVFFLSFILCFESIHPDRSKKKKSEGGGDEQLEGLKRREAEGWHWHIPQGRTREEKGESCIGQFVANPHGEDRSTVEPS